jgi:cysteine desulfurase
MTYLDWAATAPPDSDIIEASARAAIELYGNPSSRHHVGKQAADHVEECRRRISRVLSVDPAECFFTSGATEANNIVVLSQLHRRGQGHLVVSEVDHSSLRRPIEQLKRLGFEVSCVGADDSGRVSDESILDAIRPDTILVATTLVSNITGAVLDVPRLSRRIRGIAADRRRHIHHHCDCVQALGKIPFTLDELGVDSASFSAHKLCGPRGIGLLYLARQIDPLVLGGGQERDVRPGTENIGGIHGLALAVERYASDVDTEHARRLSSRLIDGIQGIHGAIVHPRGRGNYEPTYGGYSPNIVEASFPPVPGEVLARVLSDRGFAVSTGSACASNLAESHTPDRRRHAVRISIGHATTEGDIASFLNALSAETAALTSALR